MIGHQTLSVSLFNYHTARSLTKPRLLFFYSNHMRRLIFFMRKAKSFVCKIIGRDCDDDKWSCIYYTGYYRTLVLFVWYRKKLTLSKTVKIMTLQSTLSWNSMIELFTTVVFKFLPRCFTLTYNQLINKWLLFCVNLVSNFPLLNLKHLYFVNDIKINILNRDQLLKI